MNLVYALVAFILAIGFALFGATRVGAWLIERRNPPVGSFSTIDGTRLHYVHVPAGPNADLPPLVFVHGASGNLNDQMVPFRRALEGRAEMLFLDRPGHGWSQRGAGNETPSGQSRTIAALMESLGIDRAVMIGHSFGGGIVATFAVEQAQRVAGLVFLAPATHPWPGGGTSWYYELASKPVIGAIFANTLAWPGGRLQMAAATDCVFSPNRTPDGYLAETSTDLVLRPGHFRANATDVAGLYDHVRQIAPRYGEIAAPTVVVTGDSDTVVYEEIHSAGLGRDIPGAELVWVRNLGHKPDWIATDLAIAAIEKVSGRQVDLQAAARAVEQRIAADRFGVGICVDEKPAGGAELSPAQ